MNSILKRNTFPLKQQDVFALLCFLATVIFFIWKAPYSYGMEDEPFFLAFSHRLVLGDSLLTDEWNKGQLFGLVLYLPMKAYMRFAGSTEGMVLFFRYTFVAMQSVVSVVIYCRLRNYGLWAILASLITYLHIPFTFMVLSYDTVGFSFVVLTGVLLATVKKFSKATFYMIGLLVACAVICSPMLSILYILFTICMIVYESTKNRKRRIITFSNITFSFQTWLWMTLGIVTVAAIFFIFLFSRTNLKEIIENFPMLLTDPKLEFSPKEYREQNIEIRTIQTAIISIFKFSPYLFSFFGMIMAAVFIDKNRFNHRPYYLVAVSAFYIVFLAQIIFTRVKPPEYQSYFLWMLPLSLVGLACYSLSEHKDKNVFIFIWVLGFLYAILLGIGSDIPSLTAPYALGVSDIASVIFIKNMIDEMRKKHEERTGYQLHNNVANSKLNSSGKWLKPKTVAAILISALVAQVGVEVYINSDVTRYSQEYVFVDYLPASARKAKLNSVIETGPYKGIITTRNTKNLYSEMLSDLDIIKKAGRENGDYGNFLLAGGHFPWCYLYLDFPYGTYSTEIFNFVDNKRLPKYYELHPDRAPEYIYVTKFGKITLEGIPKSLNDGFLYSDPENIVAEIRNSHRCTVTESRVGYVIIISD